MGRVCRRSRRAADGVDLGRRRRLHGFSAAHVSGGWMTFVIAAASGDHEGPPSGDEEVEVE